MHTFNVLLLGAGLQSSCLLDMSLLGEIESFDLVVFADTGNEPQRVYDHVNTLQNRSEQSGVELRIVRHTAHGIVHDAKYGKFSTMPFYVMLDGKRSIMKRQCTANYKVTPCDKEIRHWLSERGLAKRNKRGAMRVAPGVRINKHFGISTDEAHRVAIPKVKYQQFEYPLITLGMSRQDCSRWYHRKGMPPPPKSSCIVCPYHSDDFWMEIRDESPQEWEMACEFDDYIRSAEFRDRPGARQIRGDLYLHGSCVPLRSVDLKPPKARRIDGFLGETLFTTCQGNAGFSCHS